MNVRDLPSIWMPPIVAGREELAEFNKMHGRYRREARQAAKPEACLLCGKPRTSYCNSHSVPEFCLRRIAVDGKVTTIASAIGTNLVKSEEGIGKAGTFHLICNDCDNLFFKGYESSETWSDAPSQRIMGQIAVKTCLYELSKAREQIPFHDALVRDFDSELSRKKASVRVTDSKDDQRNLELAYRAATRGIRSFRIVYYNVLPYVVPIAMQAMVNPIADFEGGLINNLFNHEPSYYIEPLYVCVFPLEASSIVLLFRNRRTRRYDAFERQLKEMPENEVLTSIVKLAFAYSEEVYCSPNVEHEVMDHPGLVTLARMNIDQLTLFAIGESREKAIRNVAQQGASAYAIRGLPEVPPLLSAEFALE